MQPHRTTEAGLFVAGPDGSVLAAFPWIAPGFCFRVLVQHGLIERIAHIAMFIPLTLLHYGSRRHSVRAALRVWSQPGAHGVTRPTFLPTHYDFLLPCLRFAINWT